MRTTEYEVYMAWPLPALWTRGNKEEWWNAFEDETLANAIMPSITLLETIDVKTKKYDELGGDLSAIT